MKTQRFADMASGVFLAFVGLGVVLAAFRIRGAPGVMMQPRTLPLLLGGTVGIGGAALALRAWRYRGPARVIAWPDRAGTSRVVTTLLVLAAFLLVVKPVGVPLGSAILVTFLVWFLGRYRPVYAGLLGVATGGTIWLVFIHLLQLSFPIGPLGR